MSGPDTVAVLGLGLIGGSIARDLTRRGKVVLGWDADAATLRAATASGAVHPLRPSANGFEGRNGDNGRDGRAQLDGLEGLEGLDAAGLVIIATPIGAALELLPVAARLAPRAVITDVGSTKRSIVAAAGAAGVADRFIGSHPFAGSERSGWSASKPGLFSGARVFLCPATGAAREALDSVQELWCTLGAQPEVIDPAEHDRRMAWASHAPQALSSALALALGSAGVPHAALGQGGRDMVRLAAGSSRLWSEVLLDNKEEVVAALRAAAGTTRSLAAAIEAGDAPGLERLLREGRTWSAA